MENVNTEQGNFNKNKNYQPKLGDEQQTAGAGGDVEIDSGSLGNSDEVDLDRGANEAGTGESKNFAGTDKDVDIDISGVPDEKRFEQGQGSDTPPIH